MVGSVYCDSIQLCCRDEIACRTFGPIVAYSEIQVKGVLEALMAVYKKEYADIVGQ